MPEEEAAPDPVILPIPSADDEWDDPELLEAGPAKSTLPQKRQAPPPDLTPVRPPRVRVEMGLQIGSKIRVSRGIDPADDDTRGTPVVKLECAVPDGPFQPTQVIPSPRPDETAEAATKDDTPEDKGVDWSEANRRPMRWMIGAGAGVLLVVAAALLAEKFWHADNARDLEGPTITLAPEESLTEIEGFEIVGSSQKEARALLARYATTRNEADTLPLIRPLSAPLQNMKQPWQAWPVPADWTPPAEAEWTTGYESGRGFGLLTGILPDNTPFRAYFVREHGTLVLDREATEGRCDTPFARLEAGEGGGKTRGWLMPDTYFTSLFSEDLYRSYRFVSPQRDSVVWVYARVGSREELAIAALLPVGGVIDEGPTELPMTLMLAPGGDGARKNQWRVTAVLHKDWVSP